jgi:hypothetical protein
MPGPAAMIVPEKMFTVLSGRKITSAEQRQALPVFVAAAFMVIGCIGYAYFSRFPSFMAHAPVCPWWFITGTWCPGCGTMRGISATLHGHVWGLWVYNKLSFFSMPLLLFAFLDVTFRACFRYKIPNLKPGPYLVYFVLVLIFSFWILRNVVPFLAPPSRNPFL